MLVCSFDFCYLDGFKVTKQINMKRIILAASALSLVLVQSSCNSAEHSNTADLDASAVDSSALVKAIVLENNGITLIEVLNSPNFLDAKLTLKSPLSGTELKAGIQDFKFSVVSKEYKLGSLTADAGVKGCANSDKGQHVHLIIDNQPYEASYDTNYTTKAEITAGNHVVLAFLSRSYHESLKHKEAYSLTQFTIGDDQMDAADLTAPHLFYSRPKGEYKGNDISEVMLDFYLVNTSIGENGNYVKVTINDEASFKITKWAPYLMKGLKVGVNKVTLNLMDSADKLIPGPFNAVEREFTLVQ
jgi:hypothetical protein